MQISFFPPEDWGHSTDIYWAPTSPVQCSVVKGGRHSLMAGWLLAAFGLAQGWGRVWSLLWVKSNLAALASVALCICTASVYWFLVGDLTLWNIKCVLDNSLTWVRRWESDQREGEGPGPTRGSDRKWMCWDWVLSGTQVAQFWRGEGHFLSPRWSLGGCPIWIST